MKSREKNKYITIFMMFILFSLGSGLIIQYISQEEHIAIIIDSHETSNTLHLNNTLLDEDINICSFKNKFDSHLVITLLPSQDRIVARNFISSIWQPPKL